MMTRRRTIGAGGPARWLAPAVLLAALAGCATDQMPGKPMPDMPDPGPGKVFAVVDISDQTLSVVRDFDDGRPPERHQWPVASGIPGRDTPLGYFRPDFLSPHHFSSIYHVPMPWSVFFSGNIAIHGDPDTRYIGVRASHGCVRMYPDDAKVFYGMVKEVGIANTTIHVQE